MNSYPSKWLLEAGGEEGELSQGAKISVAVVVSVTVAVYMVGNCYLLVYQIIYIKHNIVLSGPELPTIRNVV